MERRPIEIRNNLPPEPKSAFRKLSVSVPQKHYERLIAESARRKISRSPNQLLSALLREALSDYIEKLPT